MQVILRINEFHLMKAFEIFYSNGKLDIVSKISEGKF